MPLRFWITACVLSALPDADTILHRAGVPYEHAFGHRGFFHSIFFAALIAGIATPLLFRERRRQLWLFFTVIGASHGVVDAMTDGGLGIAFFAPFDDTRYFFEWRPITVAPLSIRRFFTQWGVRVMLSEIVLVWLPLGIVLCVRELQRRKVAP